MEILFVLTALLAGGVWGQVPKPDPFDDAASLIAQVLNTTIPATANDLKIRKILAEMARGGPLESDDGRLIDLIRKGIAEEANAHRDSSDFKVSLRAGAKKAQSLVAEVTAAYTQAIFRSKTAVEARRVLARFQNTIQMIVDFTKVSKYSP